MIIKSAYYGWTNMNSYLDSNKFYYNCNFLKNIVNVTNCCIFYLLFGKGKKRKKKKEQLEWS